MARELSRRELDELLEHARSARWMMTSVSRSRSTSPHPRALRWWPEYRETAALLAHSGSEAPPGLWERIDQTLEEEPPQLATPLPEGVVTFESRRTRFHPADRAVAVGVAAAVVVVGSLTVKVVQQDDRIDELGREAGNGSVLAAAETASRDPRAARVTLSSTDGALEARAVCLPDGDGFLVENNLRPLPPDRTYQLWALLGDPGAERAISAGVLGPDPGSPRSGCRARSPGSRSPRSSRPVRSRRATRP